MKSKTKISKQVNKKTNKNLVETIILAKKNKNWLEIASILSQPRRLRKDFNLSQINNMSKKNEIILVPGKVLSQGEINKKIRLIANGFSKTAEEKLNNLKIDYSYIQDEIKKNPEAKGIKILK